jgi:signal peptidase II
VEVFGRFFMLTLVYNKGGALGTSFGSTTYYLVSSLIILAIVFYYLYVNRATASLAYPLAFIAGGAIGNILDRLRLGRVVDFLDVDFFDINIFGYQLERWWTFNLADVAISCSILFLLIDIFFTPHQAKDPEQP